MRRALVPLGPGGARHALSRAAARPGPGRLPIRHALLQGRPGLWGDDPDRPEGVVLIREGDGQREAFGAGSPGPAVGWLAGQGGVVALLAPSDWEAALRAEVGPAGEVEVGVVRRLFLVPRGPRPSPTALARPLTAADAGPFAASAPPWALRAWGSFPPLVKRGAAFGVPGGSGFSSLAWVFEQDELLDAVGAWTDPRFRRLGLGRASASALVAHIVGARGKAPVWTAAAENAPSLALAAALGFSGGVAERLLRWRGARTA